MTCWACIEAFRGRGFTVYRTMRPDGQRTVRRAILAAMIQESAEEAAMKPTTGGD